MRYRYRSTVLLKWLWVVEIEKSSFVEVDRGERQKMDPDLDWTIYILSLTELTKL
jgi:hypothetical protein